MSRVRLLSRRVWLVGAALFITFAAISAVIGGLQASSRGERQHTAEVAAARALTQAVDEDLSDQQSLARVVAVTGNRAGERWRVYAHSLTSDAATYGTGLIALVPGRDRAAYEGAHENPIVTLAPGGSLVPAPVRASYDVVMAGSGRRGTPHAIVGLDLGEDSLRARYLALAAHTGQPEATPPTKLLSRRRATQGVVVFDAVIGPAGRLWGWVAASYSAGPLEAAVAQRVAGVRLSVREGAATLLAAPGADKGRHSVVDVAGQSWDVHVWAPLGSASVVPWLVLAFGALVAALAAFLVHGLELAVRERSLGLAEAQQLAAIGSWSYDPRADHRAWSPEMFRIFGRDPGAGAASDAELLNYVVAEDRPVMLAARAQSPLAGSTSSTEYRIVRGDGEVRYVHTRRFGSYDHDGTLTRLWGTTQDVTERKLSELELQRAREHSEAITAAMAEGYGLTIDGSIAAVNDALCEMTGFCAEELIGTEAPFPFWPPELVEETQKLRARVVASDGGTFAMKLLRKDGTRFDAELTARAAHNPDGSVLGFVTTFRDVSERNRRRAELDRERRDLNAAQAVARVGSWDYDPIANQPGRWSQELWRMFGLEPRPVGPSSEEFLAMIHPDDRAAVAAAINDARERRQSWSGEFRMLAADGRELVAAYRAEQSLDEAGQLVGIFGTIQDVTERAQREREEAAVREIAQQVAKGAGPAAVFEKVSAHLVGLFDAHGGSVIRFDETVNEAVFVNGLMGDGRSLIGITLDLAGQSAPAIVYRTRAASRTGGASTTGIASDWQPVIAEISDSVAAPIVVAGQLWGCLGLTFSGRAAPADTERRLERFTELVAMAIANAEAWDVLSRQASTDAITGLANHRTFTERLRAEVTRARRYHRHLSLVLFDLDHFKQVNDTYGHQAGDKVLAEVGRRLTGEVREGELVARVGGEEFAWLMPETGREGAFQAAERMRRVIESEEFPGVGTVTVSAGICTSEDGLDGDDLVRFADRALYWAKDSGRNTTFFYTDEAHALLTDETRTVERFQTMSSVRALARAIDSKDPGTREHSERVAALAEKLALALGWTEKRARQLHDCGLLHDVGKIGTPDHILLKPGPLTAEEYDQIKAHAELSARIAAEVLESEQVDWIRAHHERWDGAGYPDRVAGEQIPDGAQILAVADSFDVMTFNRSYQPPKTIREALAECDAEAGHQFSPAAVAALHAVVGEGAGVGGAASA